MYEELLEIGVCAEAGGGGEDSAIDFEWGQNSDETWKRGGWGGGKGSLKVLVNKMKMFRHRLQHT